MRLKTLRNSFIAKVKGELGTATRIVDHRVAVIAPSGTEVVPLKESDKLISTFPLRGGPESDGPGSYIATVWGAGSECEPHFDLWHNVCRIVDHLAFIYRSESEVEMIEKCGQSSQPEAASVLIQEMEKTGILLQSQPGVFDLNIDKEKQPEHFRRLLARICQTYDDVASGRVHLDGAERKAELYCVFRNLHPFQIMWRVRWESFPEGHVDLAAAAMASVERLKTASQLQWESSWKWTKIAITIGVLGLLLTVLALLLQIMG
ncbi:MAG: hypothetical protein H6822_20190 [Planctomycetaceae bacterium]|nr:hypothetical protein [Planctomycetaceae bacterium]